MAIEGLDAALAIETAGFVPQVAVPESVEPEAAATLEAALAEAGATPAPGTEAGSERLRDAVTLDLWVAEGSRAMAPVLHVGGPYDVSGAQTPDDPLILHKLTIEDMDRASGTGRNGDSTGEDEDGDYGPPIIVHGPPTYQWNYWDDHPFEPEDNDINPDGWGPDGRADPADPTPDPYADRVIIDPSVPAEFHDRAVAVDQKLTAEMREFGAIINALANNQLYQFGDKTFTGAELKEAFSHLSFRITFNDYYGPGGMGKNENGTVSNNLGYLEGMLAQNHPWGDWGTNWLILHELSHMLGFVGDFERTRWGQFWNSTSDHSLENWQRSQFFRDVEDMTSQVAYYLGGQWNTPTGPYAPLLLPPPGDGGDGGGEAGGSVPE